MKNNSLFEQVRNNRNMLFLQISMRCKHAGNWGSVTGANDTGLLVTFDGNKRPESCHPQSEMTYYDDDGAIIKDYREQQGEA